MGNNVPEITLAAATGRTDLLDRLLGAGTSPNKPTSRELSPLMAAVIAGHVKCAKKLIDAGADLTEKTEDGMSLADVSALLGREEMFVVLVRAGGRVSDQKGVLLGSVVNARPLITAEMVNRCGDLNFLNPQGATLLFFAVVREDRATTLALLKAGADPNIATTKGYTPLMMAVFKGNVEIVKLLLANGAESKKPVPVASRPQTSPQTIVSQKC